MFVLSNFLEAFGTILHRALDLYKFVIVISVLLSWVNPDPFNPLVRGLRAVTEPLLSLIRRRIPFAVVGFLDLSPVIVLMLIWFAQLFLVPSLFDLARMLR